MDGLGLENESSATLSFALSKCNELEWKVLIVGQCEWCSLVRNGTFLIMLINAPHL